MSHNQSVRPSEPLLAPAVEARIRQIVRETLTEIGLTVQIAPATVQIDGGTIAQIVWPTIAQRLDDDLSAGLSGLSPRPKT